MSAKLLSGKDIASKIKDGLRKEIEALKSKFGTGPSLASIAVGENPASAVYMKSQSKVAQDLGIEFVSHNLPESTTEEKLIEYIGKLNKDAKTCAIILQMPLPKHIDAKKAISFISPKKDAEGMHPENLGRLILGKAKVAPCTPLACMELLKETGVNLYGKEVVVVGHSEIVGKPLALLLLDKFATTTVCHIATGERGVLPEHVKKAEILIVAVGKANLIKGDLVKEGAIVIDVGINRVGDKIVGDIEFEPASQRASFITPVPGGVGPLTVTMLMRNVVEAFKAQKGIQ